MTTPKPALRLLAARDEPVCVLTGYRGPRLVPQHRQGGAGGSKLKHRTANLLHIDSLTNGLIESDPTAQLIAKVRGVKVPVWADVEEVPVFYAHEQTWYRLHGDTKTALTAGEAHAAMRDVYGQDWAVWAAQIEASPRSLVRLRAWS